MDSQCPAVCATKQVYIQALLSLRGSTAEIRHSLVGCAARLGSRMENAPASADRREAGAPHGLGVVSFRGDSGWRRLQLAVTRAVVSQHIGCRLNPPDEAVGNEWKSAGGRIKDPQIRQVGQY